MAPPSEPNQGYWVVSYVAGYETNWQAQTALRKDVFDGYDKIARPIKNSSDVIHVTFGVSIAQLVEVNERKQEIKARFKISQEMTDMRLQWDAEEYDNVTDMIVPYSKFWMPEIILQNRCIVVRNNFPLRTCNRCVNALSGDLSLVEREQKLADKLRLHTDEVMQANHACFDEQNDGQLDVLLDGNRYMVILHRAECITKT
ncbi:neuronal acetylcholine receptor subunit alpha-2-like [Saccoglossus kowalevskii]